jgi:hypothetical protein
MRVRLRTLADLDRRTVAARQVRDAIAGVTADLGGSGELSVAQSQIIERACVLGAMAADLEVKWLKGEVVDPSVLATISNSQRRLLESVGLKRVPRDVTPTLADIAAQIEASR